MVNELLRETLEMNIEDIHCNIKPKKKYTLSDVIYIFVHIWRCKV